MDYKNYNPRAAALAQARTLLTDAVKAAVFHVNLLSYSSINILPN